MGTFIYKVFSYKTTYTQRIHTEGWMEEMIDSYLNFDDNVIHDDHRLLQ